MISEVSDAAGDPVLLPRLPQTVPQISGEVLREKDLPPLSP